MRAQALLLLTVVASSVIASASPVVVGTLECSIVRSMKAIANSKEPIMDNQSGLSSASLFLKSGTGYSCSSDAVIGTSSGGEVYAGIANLALTLPSGERVAAIMGIPSNPLRSLGLTSKAGVACSCIVTLSAKDSNDGVPDLSAN